MGIEIAVSLVGLGLGFLGFGFTVWARRVDEAKNALNQVSSSIKEIVEIRFSGIADDVKQIRVDIHEFTKEQKQHAIDIATLKERNRNE